ncbi:MAG: putative quinol monooxygenase [Chloroflexota bacterium]
MSAYYGKQVRFTAPQGKGDALAEHLMAAGEDLKAEAGCVLFLISRTPDTPDVVWLTEVWVSEAAHDEVMQRESARQVRDDGAALVADVQETVLDVLGGKGL